MASPRLLYYAEQANKIPTNKPAPVNDDTAPAVGVANGMIYSAAFWAGFFLLLTLLVRW